MKFRCLRFFDISEVQYLVASNSRRNTMPDRRRWFVVGMGGVAITALRAKPFEGRSPRMDEPPVDIVSVGPEATTRVGSNFVAISRTGEPALSTITAAALEQQSFIKHLLLVRPIGYGHLAPEQIYPPRAREAKAFDYIWLIGAHRLRRLDVRAPNLAASSLASRTARHVALNLIRHWQMFDAGDWLKSLERPDPDMLARPRLGVVSISRWDPRISIIGLVRRAIYTLLNSELPLTSASRIVMFWPAAVEQDDMIDVDLAGAFYSVQLVPYPPGRAREIVCFAYDMASPGAADEQQFFDFCRALLSAYGWEEMYVGPPQLGLWRADRRIEVLVLHNGRVADVIGRNRTENPVFDDNRLIIARGTPSTKERRIAAEVGWTLIGPSEVDGWMRTVQGVALFDGAAFQ